MKRYFYLQLKRLAKLFPFVLAVTLALLVGLAAVLYGVLATFDGREENQRFSVALTGDMDNEMIQLGFSALQALDDTRFTIDFLEMSEQQAHTALEKGEIAAYVVIPEDFLNKAISGQVEPLTYVTSTGMEGIASLLKKEITTLVTDLVVYSEKGVYAMDDALDDNNLGQLSGEHMNILAFEYADLIFHRSEMYAVTELGVSDGLSTPEYYVCAVTIVLLLLLGMPFAAMHIKKDYAFHRLLLSRGHSSGAQLGCEYGVHLMAMLLLAATVLLAVTVAMGMLPEGENTDFSVQMAGALAVRAIPVIIMISAFNMMMFELSGDLVSGLLLHFFAVISLCYVSGCLYPVYALPAGMQALAAVLPTGIARSYLAATFTFNGGHYGLIGLALYAAAFYAIALLCRCRKTAGARRWLV